MINTREAIAYHEAGHAVISMKLGYKCLYVTIIPDGSRLGHVCCEDPPDWRALTKRRCASPQLLSGYLGSAGLPSGLAHRSVCLTRAGRCRPSSEIDVIAEWINRSATTVGHYGVRQVGLANSRRSVSRETVHSIVPNSRQQPPKMASLDRFCALQALDRCQRLASLRPESYTSSMMRFIPSKPLRKAVCQVS